MSTFIPTIHPFFFRRAALLGLTLVAAACDAPVEGDEGAEDESAGEESGGSSGAESEEESEEPIALEDELVLADPADPLAISTTGFASWGTPGNNGAPLDLGSDSDKTCFLQGVTGELEGAWQGTPASVRVFRQNGHWWLETRAGNGSGVMGHATCIPTVNNRRFLGWFGNTTDNWNKNWLTSNADTQCFLTEVMGTVGWASPDSFVKLQKETLWLNGVPTSVWSISGDLVLEQDGTRGGSADAVCVDIPSQTVGPYSWEAGVGSTGQIGTVTPTTSRACSVNVLAGNFAADPLGWDDGARVFPENGSWKVFASTGKKIAGNCMFGI